MRVVHIVNNLNMGGAETYLVRLCNAQVKQRIEVTVIAGEPWTLRDKLDSSVRLIDIPLWQADVSPKFPKTYLRNLWRGLPKLNRLVKESQVDLVHTHLAQSAFAGWLVAKHNKIPALHSIMHLDSAAGPWHKLIFRAKFAPNLCDGFVAFSSYAKHELARIYRIPDKKIKLARMGIDTSYFVPTPSASQALKKKYNLPSSAFLLGITARLEPVKDVSLAIQTMAVLKRHCSHEFFLLIAGDGTQREELEQQARDLSVEKRVLFLGRIGDTRQLVSGVDVYFQTTKGPNLGLAALESLAVGTPLLIAARDAEEHMMAQDTLVDPRAGWVVDAKPDLLAERIAHLIASPEEMALARAVARETAELYYDWDIHVQGILRLYQSMLQGGSDALPD